MRTEARFRRFLAGPPARLDLARSGNALAMDVQVLVDATIVEVDGALDLASSPNLQIAIERAETEQPWHIIVSLCACTYCDSTGLSILARAKKRLGDRLLVVVPRDHPVRHIFDVTRVAEYLSVVDSVEAARQIPAAFTS